MNTPDKTCIERERFRISQRDPDVVHSIATRLHAQRAVEHRCDQLGYFITPEMIAFQADQTMAWGDRDYEDPPLQSVDEHLLRVQEVLDDSAYEKRQIWVERQAKLEPERAKHRAIEQTDPIARKILRKAGIRPRLWDMLTSVVFVNLDGTVKRRLAKPKDTLKSVRRDFLMHHGWSGEDEEPEWAAEIRSTQVNYIEALDGNGRGKRWIICRAANPKEQASSYVDPSPGLGDDGRYRWVGESLIFDPNWTHRGEHHRLSIAEFETAMVQGAQIEGDYIENELVGGDPVTLDLDTALDWHSPEDNSPNDCRHRGCNGDYWDPVHLSHDEQFFHEVLIGMGEFDLAESLLRRGRGPDRLGLIKCSNGKLYIEHLGEEPPGKPWDNDPELRLAMIEAMGITDYMEFEEYF